MKTLILMRHAKSDSKAEVKKERNRPISKKGARLARIAASQLRAKIAPPQVILASPSKKVGQTVDILTREINFEGKVDKHKALYMAEADTLLKLIRKLPEEMNTALIVGHNPGLESLIPTLTHEIVALPHAGLAFLSLPVERWKDVRQGMAAQLVEVLDPREEPAPAPEIETPENTTEAGVQKSPSAG